MTFDPVTGPFSRRQFQALVEMPFGEACKAIQKIDPFWGRGEGEKFDFEVTASARMQGRAVVKAASLKEAHDLADKLGEHDFDWGGYGCGSLDIIEVLPRTED